jgi:hypothetical protein
MDIQKKGEDVLKKMSVKKEKKKIEEEIFTPRCFGRLRKQSAMKGNIGEIERKEMSREQP